MSHVYRELNTVAHSVVKWVLSSNQLGTILISSLPAHVLEEREEGWYSHLLSHVKMFLVLNNMLWLFIKKKKNS